MTLQSEIRHALETAGVWVIPVTRKGQPAFCLPEYGWLFVGPLSDRQRVWHYKACLRGVRTAVVETTTEALLTVTNWQIADGNRVAQVGAATRPKYLRVVK